MEPIRIGTRDSKLALWQAEQVSVMLNDAGIANRIIPVKSDGDIDLKTPLYEMGVQGIFTKSLDIALLQGKIDVAVHSMKDVPTALPHGIVQAAVLERGNHKDIFVPRSETDVPLFEQTSATIATSSIRRSAQWLHRYPDHRIENLRGNVITRLQKLSESHWQGAIFAAAGLERIGIRPSYAVELDWMLSAPAQGAIMVVCRGKDDNIRDACFHLNHPLTEMCTGVERDFLRELMGGCTMPISAFAYFEKNELVFRGNILSVDGKKKTEIEKRVSSDAAIHLGKQAAQELLESGGAEIVKGFRHGH